LSYTAIDLGRFCYLSWRAPVPAEISRDTVTAQPPPPCVARAGADYQGYHDRVDCEFIPGWVRDPRQPECAVIVEIYADGSRLVTLTADILREDLLEAGKGRGFHAFSYPVPPSIIDGRPHTIRVTIAGTQTDLNNTRQVLTCGP
jgi:hypothetical protein